eukprot:g26026.t1
MPSDAARCKDQILFFGVQLAFGVAPLLRPARTRKGKDGDATVAGARPEGKPKGGSRSRPTKKRDASEPASLQATAEAKEVEPRGKGSGSRGRDKPKQDSRHWEESIDSQLKVPGSQQRATSADSNASYVSAVSQREASSTPPRPRASAPRTPSKPRAPSAPSAPSASSADDAAELDAPAEAQGYKQRRAMLLAQQRYRESMSYGRRRQSALARSGENAQFLSFAEYRKAMSYGARRAQELTAQIA